MFIFTIPKRLIVVGVKYTGTSKLPNQLVVTGYKLQITLKYAYNYKIQVLWNL